MVLRRELYKLCMVLVCLVYNKVSESLSLKPSGEGEYPGMEMVSKFIFYTIIALT